MMYFGGFNKRQVSLLKYILARIKKLNKGLSNRKLSNDENWRFAVRLSFGVMQYFLGTKSNSSSLLPLGRFKSLPHVSFLNHCFNQSFLNNIFYLVMMVKIISKSMSRNTLMVELLVLVILKVELSQLVVQYPLNAMS